MGTWHNDTEMPAHVTTDEKRALLDGDTLPEAEPPRVVVLPRGTTTATQAEQWADLHSSRWKAQQQDAAQRVSAGVKVHSLGALQDLQGAPTTRRYSRTLAEAFPREHAYAVTVYRSPWRSLIRPAVFFVCVAFICAAIYRSF